MCDKSRELRKKRFEPEGSEKYRKMNKKIKRCMKKAKENWIGEQSGETEENLRENNSKKVYQLMKDLTTAKQDKATTVQDRSGRSPTEEREILNRWTEYCTEPYNHKANGDPPVLGVTLKSLRPSIGLSVFPSVRLSVYPSVVLSVCPIVSARYLLNSSSI